MKLRPSWFYRQSGVIPYRIVDGAIQVLLVTSRGSGRWIIPKGVVELHLSADESAKKEAYEEAGIEGTVDRPEIGEYQYEKWGGTCTVTVFTMRVDTILEKWPESDKRKRRWMSIDDAAETVDRKDLRVLIRRLRELIESDRGV